MLCATGCGAEAELIGVYDDEVTGNELAVFRCGNDHEWEQPSRSQVIRMIGWGYDWRRRRDQIRGQLDGEPLPATLY